MNRSNAYLLIGGGLASLAAAVFWREELKDLVVPSTTGKHRVDAILPKLQQASLISGIPLGVLVGWIIKESAGKLGEVTSLDERGYFQLHPDESKALSLDHRRLSIDSDYSIAGGIAMIKSYMTKAAALGIAPVGSEYFWKVVKLLHTMGVGAAGKVIAAAKAAGAVGSWDALERFAVANDATLLAQTKHSPRKWFPMVDGVYDSGRAFGFGTGRA